MDHPWSSNSPHKIKIMQTATAVVDRTQVILTSVLKEPADNIWKICEKKMHCSELGSKEKVHTSGLSKGKSRKNKNNTTVKTRKLTQLVHRVKILKILCVHIHFYNSMTFFVSFQQNSSTTNVRVYLRMYEGRNLLNVDVENVSVWCVFSTSVLHGSRSSLRVLLLCSCFNARLKHKSTRYFLVGYGSTTAYHAEQLVHKSFVMYTQFPWSHDFVFQAGHDTASLPAHKTPIMEVVSSW